MRMNFSREFDERPPKAKSRMTKLVQTLAILLKLLGDDACLFEKRADYTVHGCS